MNTTQPQPKTTAIMEKILADLEAATPKALAAPADEAPGPFTFSDKKDKVGIRYESQAYVDKSCNDCYGRGYQIYLIGDGYIGKAATKDVRLARKARDLRACRCVIRAYVRARVEWEKGVKLGAKALGIDEAEMRTRMLADVK